MVTLLRRHRLSVVLIVLALVAGGWLYTVATREDPAAVVPLIRDDGEYRPGTLASSAAEDAVAAAVATLPKALSYDYRSLDKSLASATARMTEDFGDEFEETFDVTTRPMATEKKAITSALVRGAGIVGTVEDDKATVLVFLDQVLLSSTTKESNDPLEVGQNRLRVELREVDGDWLVDDIAPF